MKFSFTDILFMVFVGPIPPSMLKAPKPPVEPIKPPEVPETQLNITIPILFGRRRMPVQVTWYGDVKITKEKVNASSKK